MRENIKSYIDYLNLDSFNIEKKEKKEDLINTLKSKSLFLNNIGINTILGFNISKLKVGNFEDENYNFKIKMVPGRFDIKDINLNIVDCYQAFDGIYKQDKFYFIFDDETIYRRTLDLLDTKNVQTTKTKNKVKKIYEGR